jgi:hypothetical protein
MPARRLIFTFVESGAAGIVHLNSDLALQTCAAIGGRWNVLGRSALCMRCSLARRLCVEVCI